MTSTNGIDWTIGSTPVDNNWNAVCWSSLEGRFYAVSSTGTYNRAMTSTDGINWTIEAPRGAGAYSSICYSPELRMFAASGVGATASEIMTKYMPIP
jgi:hypothetical protein